MKTIINLVLSLAQSIVNGIFFVFILLILLMLLIVLLAGLKVSLMW